MLSKNFAAWGRALKDKEFRRMSLVFLMMQLLMSVAGEIIDEGWVTVLQVFVFLVGGIILARKLDEFY